MDGETLLAWQGVLVLIVVATVVTVLALVIARQYGRAVAARTALHRDQAYRELAAAAVAAQQRYAASLADLVAEVGELKRSVAAVERLLREVG
jgi:hypothetical protein